MLDYTTTMVMCTYVHVHKTERRKRKKEKTVIIIKRNADVSGQIFFFFFSFAAAQLLNFFSHPTFSHRSRWSWRERQGKPVGLVFFLVVLSYITRLNHVTRWERERDKTIFSAGKITSMPTAPNAKPVEKKDSSPDWLLSADFSCRSLLALSSQRRTEKSGRPRG